MSELMWVRSHVEQLLEREWELGDVTADDDGDYPFRRGSAMCWVSIMDTEPVMVRVYAHAAYGVKPSAKLLQEINEVQHRSLSARVELVQDLVLVSQTISPWGLTQPVLSQALDAVGTVAAEVGPLLAAMFDGATPFEAEVSDPADEDVT
jgi:hypothetical protein